MLDDKIKNILNGEGYSDFQIAEMKSDGIFNDIDPDDDNVTGEVIDNAKEWYEIQELLEN